MTLVTKFVSINLMITSVMCQSYPSVMFQSDGVPSTESYLVSQSTSFPTMTKLSFCVHLYLVHARGDEIPLISYAVENYPDEVLISFNVIKGIIYFECCKGNIRFESSPLVSMKSVLEWIHLCVVIDLEEKDIKTYINKIAEKGYLDILNDTLVSITSGGTVVLGQEQDIIRGGFSLKQSFEGYLARCVVNNTIFSDHQIEEFLNCMDSDFHNVIFSFENLNTKWKSNGATDIVKLKVKDICHEKNVYLTVFPEHRTYKDAFALCKILKGQISVPTNEMENDKLVQVSQNVIDSCSTEYGTYMRVGVKLVKNRNETNVLTDTSGNKEISYSNFRYGHFHVYLQELCGYLDRYELGKWLMDSCTVKTCVTCQFNTQTLLRLRGLCSTTLLDRVYVLRGYYNNKPKFEGIRHSRIIWTNTTWAIEDSISTKVSALMQIAGEMDYPMGLKRWRIQEDSCPGTNHYLLFTSCSSKDYTCNDGTCIPKEKRCDFEAQCPDLSDEARCNPVIIPDDYIKELPPPKLGKEPAKVSLSTEILAVYPLDTLNLRVSIEIVISLQWKDGRLAMEALNDNEATNLVSKTYAIWVPYFIIEDSSGSETKNTYHWKTFVVVRESLPLDDDITRTKEDEIFPGSQNSLKLTNAYSTEFSCQMNLASYPFDSQYCSIVIRLKDVGNEFVIFEPKGQGVTYTGPTYLKEYQILGVTMAADNTKNFSSYKITIRFDNLSGFYIFSTYIPTFLMVVICYSTFFFEMSDFNDRIMVSLTALLVLATLFTQITQTTPKTAYLKLLDVWFVSCIFINFLIVVILVAINYIKISEEEHGHALTQTKVRSFKNPIKFQDHVRKSKHLNQKAIIGVPILVIIFSIVYIIIALTIAN